MSPTGEEHSSSTSGLLVGVGLAVTGLSLVAGGVALHTGGLTPDPVVAVSFLTVGAILSRRRPSHPIGWLMLAVGSTAAILYFTTEYSRFYPSPRHFLAGAGWMAWVRGWAVDLIWLELSLFLLWFPSGRPASKTWRVVERLVVANAVFGVAVVALWPEVNSQPSGHPPVQPIHLPGRNIADALYTVHGVAQLATLAVVVVGVALRLRRAPGVERLQLKWFSYAGSLFVVATIVGVAGWGNARVGVALLPLVVAATAFAVLKYRLYDIDAVLSKTVVVVVLGAFVAVVYTTVVTVLGARIGGGFTHSRIPSLLATAIVAVGFQPVRLRADRLGARLVYGRASTPYDVLAQLPLRVLEAGPNALSAVARACADGVRCTTAEVWRRRDEEFVLAASYPPPPSDAGPKTVASLNELSRAGHIATIHDGELLVGVLRVVRRADDPIKSGDLTLLQDVAREAALVLRNLHLAQELEDRANQLASQAVELRSSRSRIVAAQDAERRRIERNLHDGAQQRLVTLALRLRTAEAGSSTPDNLRAEIDRAVTELGSALGELRETARGIHPSLLTEEGLAGAIQALADRCMIPVDVGGVPDRRFSTEVEYATYYVVAEALTNTTKHADAAQARVHVAHSGAQLRVEVTDDGCGGASMAKGSGLRGLSDRVAALDGSLELSSSPEGGTTLVALIPCT